MMRMAGTHVHAAVMRAITRIAGAALPDRQKPVLIVEDIRSQDWASVTFIGATHAIDLRLEGDADVVAAANRCLISEIAEHDIPVAGQIVADIAVTLSSVAAGAGDSIAHSLTVNLLTILD
jgi:hypothetical protein